MRDPVTGNFWSGPNNKSQNKTMNQSSFVIIKNGNKQGVFSGLTKQEAKESWAKEQGFESYQELTHFWAKNEERVDLSIYCID